MRTAKHRGRVLVVEDEAYVRDSLGELLRARGYDVDLEVSSQAALDCLAHAPIDVVLTDLKLGSEDGIDVVRRVRAAAPEIPVLVLTGHGTIASAVACIKAGASEYILKPADPDVLDVALERAVSSRALRRELDHLRKSGGTSSPDRPLGQSAIWRRTLERVQAAAPTDSTVLFLGESGTGKDLLARMIHNLSQRAGSAFIRVNCAAIPMEMWESEFFGHRRGSFTGATADREGRFVLANCGTMLMDEVGTMPLGAQAKILRVLQDGEFDRLGDTRPTRVDVRIVAATNSDLESEIAGGRFRRDLYYRLNVVRIVVPPLRDRIEDIPPLAEHFVREISVRLGRPAPVIGPAVLEDLKSYSWPGNVRELRNVIERSLILNPADELALLDFSTERALTELPGAAIPELSLRANLGHRERELVLEALRRSGGVRKEAARLLGIDQRNLPYYVRKHGIDPNAIEG